MQQQTGKWMWIISGKNIKLDLFLASKMLKKTKTKKSLMFVQSQARLTNRVHLKHKEGC